MVKIEYVYKKTPLETKKSHKKLIGVLILIIAVAAIASYFFIFKNIPTEEQQEPSQQQTTPQTQEQMGEEKGGLAEDCTLLLSGTIFKDGPAVADKAWYCFKDREPSSIPPDYGDYSIVLLDKDGKILDEFKFQVSFSYLQETWEGYKTVEINVVPFMFEILAKKGTSEILIKHFDNILIRELVSKNTPTVKIIFPNGGEILEKNKIYTIKWEGYDADGDELIYTLAYTNEEMREAELAMPINLDYLNKTEFTWSINDFYQTGNDYQINVIVTDGINTNEDTSDGTFTIS